MNEKLKELVKGYFRKENARLIEEECMPMYTKIYDKLEDTMDETRVGDVSTLHELRKNYGKKYAIANDIECDFYYLFEMKNKKLIVLGKDLYTDIVEQFEDEPKILEQLKGKETKVESNDILENITLQLKELTKQVKKLKDGK